MLGVNRSRLSTAAGLFLLRCCFARLRDMPSSALTRAARPYHPYLPHLRSKLYNTHKYLQIVHYVERNNTLCIIFPRRRHNGAVNYCYNVTRLLLTRQSAA